MIHLYLVAVATNSKLKEFQVLECEVCLRHFTGVALVTGCGLDISDYTELVPYKQ